jgi:magnesium chelatase subunit I
MMPSAHYVHQVKGSDELRKAVNRLGVGESPAALASAMEFILEGLHLHRKLNKDRADGQSYYRR